MALHPQCKAFLDQLATMGGKPLHETPPAEARKTPLPPALAGDEQPVARVEDRRIPGPAGAIAVRVYWPSTGRRLPALIFAHGGGFVLGNIESADRPCRALANLSGAVVINVDYRLAPEHPFPAAVDDFDAVTQYVAEHADEFGIDPHRLAVGGESAGGNLAAVTAIVARDRGTPAIAFQLLIYPQVDMTDVDRPSMREFASGYFITREIIDYFTGHYLSRASDPLDPRASPLLASDLTGLPPAFIMTAECDPLRDQGEEYARRLQQSGVKVMLKRYDGMFHPFFSLAAIIDEAKVAHADAAAALRDALKGEPLPA